MIITFPGNAARNKIPYHQSYPIMNNDWNKLCKVIKYRYPDYKYILFPRAQSKPIENNPIGYCHFHVIHNKRIPKPWLDNKCKRYTLGYTFLRYNEDVADYLHRDFYDDDEWIIPFNIKHHRSSRSILIRHQYKANPDNIIFMPTAKISTIEHTVNEHYTRILPFEEYISQFIQITSKTHKKETSSLPDRQRPDDGGTGNVVRATPGFCEEDLQYKYV
jgi:hypothetical protein